MLSERGSDSGVIRSCLLKQSKQKASIGLFFLFCVLQVSLIEFKLNHGAHDTEVGVWVWLVGGETLLQEKNFADYWWNSNPDPCR